MSSALVPALVVGGVAYVATRPSHDVPPTGHPGYSTGAYPGQPTVGAGNAPSATGLTAQSPVFRMGYLAGTNRASIARVDQRYTVWSSDLNIDPELRAKFDQIEAAAEKAYNDANEVAKAQAADALNKELKLDPPLTGHEDWKTVSAVVGGATGGAVGGAIGGPIGAKLGALAGAYLGVKLEELIEKNLDEIKAWISDKWGEVKEFASDVYDEVSGWAPW